MLLLLPDLHVHLFPVPSFSSPICLANPFFFAFSAANVRMVALLTFCSTLASTLDNPHVEASFFTCFTLECQLVTTQKLVKGHSYLRVDLKLLERAFRSLTLFTTSFFTLPCLETCSAFPSFRLCSSPCGMPFFLLPQLLRFGLPIKDQTFTISQCFTMTELST